MATPTAGPMAGSHLLIGWNAISRFCGKSPRALRRYRRLEAFPAHRWGTHVVALPGTIRLWLMSRDRIKRQRKAQGIT